MRRIAIPVDNAVGLNSVISPHFGRCPYFMLVDLDGDQVVSTQAVANPFYPNHEPGQVPAFVHSQGAHVMLAGGMGGRAIAFFEEYGIETVTGATGTVVAALDQYRAGRMPAAAPCAESARHGQGGCGGAHSERYEKNEVGRLREEADSLGDQLADVDSRLKRLAKGD